MCDSNGRCEARTRFDQAMYAGSRSSRVTLALTLAAMAQISSLDSWDESAFTAAGADSLGVVSIHLHGDDLGQEITDLLFPGSPVCRTDRLADGTHFATRHGVYASHALRLTVTWPADDAQNDAQDDTVEVAEP